jgi:hypothetical protein
MALSPVPTEGEYSSTESRLICTYSQGHRASCPQHLAIWYVDVIFRHGCQLPRINWASSALGAFGAKRLEWVLLGIISTEQLDTVPGIKGNPQLGEPKEQVDWLFLASEFHEPCVSLVPVKVFRLETVLKRRDWWICRFHQDKRPFSLVGIYYRCSSLPFWDVPLQRLTDPRTWEKDQR